MKLCIGAVILEEYQRKQDVRALEPFLHCTVRIYIHQQLFGAEIQSHSALLMTFSEVETIKKV